MTTYRLRPIEGTATFRKITTGRRWVGRVAPHAEGGWLGVIGQITVRQPTPEQAFREVAARALGHSSAASLKAHNSQVRRANRARRTYAAHDLQAALDALLGRMPR